MSVDWPFFKADILICHGRISTGVANNITDGSVVLSYPTKPWQWANTRTLKPKHKWSWAIINFITLQLCFSYCENDYSETSFNRFSSHSSNLHLTLFGTYWAYMEGQGRHVCCSSGLRSFRGHFDTFSAMQTGHCWNQIQCMESVVDIVNPSWLELLLSQKKKSVQPIFYSLLGEVFHN